MGDYYNKTRSPVPVTLLRGGAISIGPKEWCFINPADEGTASLMSGLKKGFLVRALVPRTVADPVVVAIPATVLAPTPAPEPIKLVVESEKVAVAVVQDPAVVTPKEPTQAVTEFKTATRKGK